MNNFFDNFNSEAIFSTENPFLKSAQKTHGLFAEAFDKTARMQLAFAEDLLDLNKKRFASLYAGESVQDTIATQQELLADAGNRTFAVADELQKVSTDLKTDITDAANEWMAVATEAVTNIAETAKPAKAGKKAA